MARFEDVDLDGRINAMRASLLAEPDESAAIAEDPCRNPICDITIDEGLSALVLTWKRYATSRQLRFILEWALAQIRRRELTRILADDTNVPVLHAADRRWIANDWLPRAAASGVRWIASKAPDSHFGRLATEDVRAAAPSAITARAFPALPDARAWLLENTP